MPLEVLLTKSRILLYLIRSHGSGSLAGAVLHCLDQIFRVRWFKCSPLPLDCAVAQGRRIARSKSAGYLKLNSGGHLFPDFSRGPRWCTKAELLRLFVGAQHGM